MPGPRAARHQQPHVAAVERLLRVIEDVDPVQQGKGAVIQLHRRPLRCA